LHAVQWLADGLRQVVTAGLAVWVVRRQLLPETAAGAPPGRARAAVID
jgi:hypothetical protein